MSGGWGFGAWSLDEHMADLEFRQHPNLLSLLSLPAFCLGISECRKFNLNDQLPEKQTCFLPAAMLKLHCSIHGFDSLKLPGCGKTMPQTGAPEDTAAGRTHGQAIYFAYPGRTMKKELGSGSMHFCIMHGLAAGCRCCSVPC